MNGGKLGRLGRNRIEDLAYYYDNLKKYVENVNQLLYRYVGGQQRIFRIYQTSWRFWKDTWLHC